ncbi:hypothetical protein [Sedimentibacter sp.]|uniref:hypothetical protein n=1 Tax=Sedimentibacter sp. TaxID=1960295 RepID=UPI0028A189B5|nr:hypothetical protein [Sedimentibacter sp.]
MTFDLMEIFNQILGVLGNILNSFTVTKNVLQQVVSDVQTMDYLTIINPYIGTIRYVAGEKIFTMTIRLAQIGIFIGIAKAAYQLVHMITNSNLIKKPTQLIKSFLGL